MRRLRTFWKLDPRVKWLFFKAMVISVIVRIALTFFPFRIVLGWLGKTREESDRKEDAESLQVRKDVKRAVGLCDRYSFWKTECYTQALIAKILLKNYGLPSTIYIGFFKEGERDYKGHAWLRSYDTVLTGGAESGQFSVQCFFT